MPHSLCEPDYRLIKQEFDNQAKWIIRSGVVRTKLFYRLNCWCCIPWPCLSICLFWWRLGWVSYQGHYDELGAGRISVPNIPSAPLPPVFPLSPHPTAPQLVLIEYLTIPFIRGWFWEHQDSFPHTSSSLRFTPRPPFLGFPSLHRAHMAPTRLSVTHMHEWKSNAWMKYLVCLCVHVCMCVYVQYECKIHSLQKSLHDLERVVIQKLWKRSQSVSFYVYSEAGCRRACCRNTHPPCYLKVTKGTD